MVARWWTSVSRERRTVAVALFTLGLLLWARLIVLSDMPRTAIADEEPSSGKAVAPDVVESGDVHGQHDASQAPLRQPVHEVDFASEPAKSTRQLTEDRK